MDEATHQTHAPTASDRTTPVDQLLRRQHKAASSFGFLTVMSSATLKFLLSFVKFGLTGFR
jgi:hypothetical protein